uniref:U4/U6 small nuclear ribonucleoprotein Prp3-like n=1 Tax=Hirondellea gigas TaxID=1518452 RepID=A0A2P2I311_9CRUS
MALSKRDYEVYKSGVDKLVYKYLSRERTAAASVITGAVDAGADKRKLADKLAAYTDKALAHKLADKAFQLLDDLGVRLKSSSRKRTHKDEADNGSSDHDKELKKPRTEVQQTLLQITPLPPLSPATPAASMHQKQIEDIMAKATAAIEERKRALSSLQHHPSARLTGASNGATAPAVPSTIDRIAELQARIRSQMGTIPMRHPSALTTPVPPLLTLPIAIPCGVANPMSEGVDGTMSEVPKPPTERPPPIILDSEGRTLDLTGKEVHITYRAPTLKANIRAKKREEFKQQLAEKPGFDETPDAEFYDSRLPSRPSARQQRLSFKFHDQGKFIQLAQRERAKSRLEKLQTEISSAARRTGISSAARLAQLQGDSHLDTKGIPHKTPTIEWWDAVLLGSASYPAEGEEVRAKADYITKLVEHPLEMRCPCDTNKIIDLKVFLTAQERKKLRRMNRREAWKEKQDKIRLGLERPPEPKVRMANLMRVLGTEAVLDPTKMEKHVRDQMAKRLQAHEQANADRKLTPQQRKDKRISKLKEDTSSGVHVSVFRVTDLSNGSHKFKVETNAKQLFMTGTVVLFRDVNVVVVEGGPKQQKKYRQLMMHRIKWLEEARTNTEAAAAAVEPKCQLVWEGTVLERSFGEMQFKACPSERFARDHFKKHGVEHYWDMVYGKKVAEEANITAQ